MSEEKRESLADLLAHVQFNEVRLVRKIHRIGFRSNGRPMPTVDDLLAILSRVPRNAVLIEVELHDGEKLYCHEVCTLKFREEATE